MFVSRRAVAVITLADLVAAGCSAQRPRGRELHLVAHCHQGKKTVWLDGAAARKHREHGDPAGRCGGC